MKSSFSLMRKLVIAGVLLALALLAGVFAFSDRRGRRDEAARATELYVRAEEGPLVINLEEKGEIAPSQQLILKSEVQGRSSIIYIVPEGSMVRKGDLLVELDSSSKVDEKVNQEITLQNAESNFNVARENLEIVRNQADSDVELAEQDKIFAQEDLVKYEEGEYPTKLSETRGNVTLAEQTLQQSKDKYEWSKKLFDENFLSESELRSDELTWKHNALSLETAKGNLDLLERYTHKRELAKLKSDLRQKTMAYERTTRRAKSSVAQAESELRAREREFNMQKQKLDKLVDQIAKAKIYAPMGGQVIYATSAGRARNREPLQEGQEVWERQELIYLPTADTFEARVSVHESGLKSLTTGMPVRVRCDALPDKVFQGRLVRISPMPDNERRWMNPDLKEYPADIALEGGVGELKSGMSCKAEIVLAQYERAVYVPVQCLVRIGKTSCVWVRTANGPVRRTVEAGLDNNRFVRILSGLSAGEEVLLTPPLEESTAEKDRETIGETAGAKSAAKQPDGE